MTSTDQYTCGICLENLNVSNNFMITQCGHPFHSTCCLAWTFRGNFNCPLCIQPLVDKNSIDEYNGINGRREYNQREYHHTIIDDLNNEISVYLYKMIINDLTYFISSDNNSKVFFNIFNNEDIDFLDEIGYYDWNSNRIIYKYDVSRHVIGNKIYLITNNGEVYDYKTHMFIVKYDNSNIDQIINFLSIQFNNHDIYSNYPNIDPECNDSEDFVLPGFFYFRGQTYKIEDGQKVDISIALGSI
jgi:hypothetical protein